MADKTATWSVEFKSDVGPASREAAAGLEQLRSKAEASQTTIKGLAAAHRALRGSSDEVVAAKAQLKAQLDAERGAFSQLTLAIIKQGSSLEQLTAQAKAADAAQRKADAAKRAEEQRRLAEAQTRAADAQKRLADVQAKAAEAQKRLTEQTKRYAEEDRKLTEAQGKLGQAFRAGGGPLADFHARLTGVRDLAEGAGGKLALLAAGTAIAVAGVAKLTSSFIEGAIGMGRWLIASADALRNMGLMRQAASGSAENAAALGTQVDRLARKVPLAKAQINDLAVEMTRAMSGGLSRANGATIVASIEAVSTATAAAGDQVGSTFRGLIERGKNFGRFWLSPQDMQGTGLRFTEVAEALAARLHVSLAKAKDVLFRGGLDLATGVGAFKDAINSKFAAVNADKMLSVDVQLTKFQDKLQGLAKGVALEPLLRGLNALLSKFDEGTVTGKSLQVIFARIGNALASIDVAKLATGIETVALWGLRATEGFWKFGVAINATLDNPLIQTALTGLKIAAFGVAAAFGVVATVLFGAALVIGGVGKAIGFLWEKGKALLSLDWAGIGRGVIDGLVNGIKDGARKVWDAVTGVGTTIKDAFKSALDIHSPSKVFAMYGRQTAAGFNQGLAEGAASGVQVAGVLAPSPTGAGAGGGAAGGGMVAHVQIIVQVPPGTSAGEAQGIARAVSAPSILRELTRALREGMVTQGVPTGAGAAG